jgi:archaellum component FlaC
MSENDSKIQSINETLIRMEHTLDNLTHMQNATHTDVRDIKNAIYNPDNGLYSRVKDLESWQRNVSKVLWSGGLSVLALITKTFYDIL